jgi:hypothetical protein
METWNLITFCWSQHYFLLVATLLSVGRHILSAICVTSAGGLRFSQRYLLRLFSMEWRFLVGCLTLLLIKVDTVFQTTKRRTSESFDYPSQLSTYPYQPQGNVLEANCNVKEFTFLYPMEEEASFRQHLPLVCPVSACYLRQRNRITATNT